MVNLADGSVEVIACGEQSAVERLCEWLWEGSPMSSVESVVCAEWRDDPPEGFQTG